MDDNVEPGPECNTDVIDPLVDAGADIAKEAVRLRAQVRRRHHIHRCALWCVSFRPVEDLTIFLAGFLQYMLGCEKYMR